MGSYEMVLLLTNVPGLLVLIGSLYQFGRASKALRIFSVLVLVSNCIQLVSMVLWYLEINNMPLLHLQVPVCTLLIVLFYRQVLFGFIQSWLFIGAGTLFALFSVLNSVFFQPVNTFNSYALTAQCILVVILALSLYNLFLNPRVKQELGPHYSSLYWINTGFFIYYVSCLLIFNMGEVMQIFSIEINLYVWMLHSFFYVLMYVCFTVGLWKMHKR